MFAVTQDPASLDNLHDVVASAGSPQAMAPGWYVLFFFLAVVTLWAMIKWIRYRLKNHYRKEALRELELIRSEALQPDKRNEVVAKLNRLLKRVALAGWTRKQVANYSGDDWLEFINRTGGKSRLSAEQMKALRDSAYSTRIRNSISTELLIECIDTTDKWIRNHQALDFDFAGPGDTSQRGESKS